jgi:hypothetical protein
MRAAKFRNSPITRWVARAAAFALPLAALLFVARAPRALAGDCCGGGKPEDGKAGETVKSESGKQAAGLLVDAGNAKCPVMGGKPDGKTWSEWNGLRVGHCCPMCTAKFAADPERYLKQAGVDWKAAVAAIRKVGEAKGADRAAALAELKKHWTVVREPEAAPAPKGTLVDLANAKCPVRGGAVDGKTFSEWNGLRVGHCCPGCGEKFLANPEKLLADAKIEWKAAADAVKAVDAAKGADRAKALAELKSKWKVVREPAAEDAKK